MEKMDQLLNNQSGLSSKYYYGTYKNCLKKYNYVQCEEEIERRIKVYLQGPILDKSKITKSICEQFDCYGPFVRQKLNSMCAEVRDDAAG